MPLESALSYLKGTSFKLDTKDVVLRLYWEMFYVSGDRMFLASLHRAALKVYLDRF